MPDYEIILTICDEWHPNYDTILQTIPGPPLLPILMLVTANTKTEAEDKAIGHIYPYVQWTRLECSGPETIWEDPTRPGREIILDYINELSPGDYPMWGVKATAFDLREVKHPFVRLQKELEEDPKLRTILYDHFERWGGDRSR